MKKLICLVLTLIMILSALTFTVYADNNSSSEPITGDVGGDLTVSITDATLVQLYLAQNGELSLAQKVSADTNGDAEVTILDATIIQLYLVSLIDTFAGDSDSVPLSDSIGRINTLHNIMLYEELPYDTYTLKYEDENGVLATCADICTIEISDTTDIPSYSDLIKENVAPINATKIGVYNSSSERMGSISLPSGFAPILSEKLYSFGAISDTHLGQSPTSKNDYYSTSTEDFIRAMTYFSQEENIDFIAHCGDITVYSTEEELQLYNSLVNEYAGGLTLHVAAGNHEEYLYNSSDYLEEYMGNLLYYSFTHNDDVYIFVGIMSSHEDRLFLDGELQWLYETLEENRNKRCFVFQHILTKEGSGDALNLLSSCKLKEYKTSIAFKNLMSHYENAIHFHGHSHMAFELQQYSETANYDNVFGSHSVHIPSLSVPRGVSDEGKLKTMFEKSEGYVVDVYENGIYLRGRDFVNNQDVPISQYYLDTTLKTIEENTFVDTTGLIDTSTTQ
ncbi:MAG: metallophosphoesterase [Ruminococcus sp.]|nr:metallophosphoesterase [Ruminococcus sp.]